MTYDPIPSTLSTESTNSTNPKENERLSTLSTLSIGVDQPWPLIRITAEILGEGTPERYIGIPAIPGRLPEMRRKPGEGMHAFTLRALSELKGIGAVVQQTLFISDTRPTSLGSSRSCPR